MQLVTCWCTVLCNLVCRCRACFYMCVHGAVPKWTSWLNQATYPRDSL